METGMLDAIETVPTNPCRPANSGINCPSTHFSLDDAPGKALARLQVLYLTARHFVAKLVVYRQIHHRSLTVVRWIEDRQISQYGRVDIDDQRRLAGQRPREDGG